MVTRPNSRERGVLNTKLSPESRPNLQDKTTRKPPNEDHRVVQINLSVTYNKDNVCHIINMASLQSTGRVSHGRGGGYVP